MRRLLKLWLLCLLSLALPVQGAAAVSMLSCGSSHHGMDHSASAPQDHAMHAQGSMHHAADDEGAADDEVSKAKCSACASCCIAAALPSPAMSVEGTTQPCHFAVASSPSSPTFFTGGPERPPRSFLA